MTVGFGLDAKMFDTQRINFHTFEGNKNGSPKEHKFRVLPAYAQGKLFHKAGLHWGYRNVDGKMRALVCSLESNGSCPICDKIKNLRGNLENIDAALQTQFDPEERQKLEQQKIDITEYISNHRRKPMYLWNILTEDGTQKVLQLSWNGHDPLFEKIKFIFNTQKIDVTSIKQSILMYCNRSGLKAKTRYQYESMPNTEKDLTGTVTKLTDLSKVYLTKSTDYLQKVVDTEVVPPDNEDPNDRNFDAQSNQPPKKQEVPVQPTTEQPAPQTYQTTMGEVPVVESPVVAPAAQPLSGDQEQNVADMMNLLQGK